MQFLFTHMLLFNSSLTLNLSDGLKERSLYESGGGGLKKMSQCEKEEKGEEMKKNVLVSACVFDKVEAAGKRLMREGRISLSME